MSRFSQNTRRSENKMIPFTVDGIAALLPVDTVPVSAWTSAHGKTIKGETVNSARILHIGDDVVIRSGDGKGFLSLPAAEFEVLARVGAENAGYIVTAPSA